MASAKMTASNHLHLLCFSFLWQCFPEMAAGGRGPISTGACRKRQTKGLESHSWGWPSGLFTMRKRKSLLPASGQTPRPAGQSWEAPSVVNKVLWNPATPTCPSTIYGCFCNASAEVSSRERFTACKA